MAVFCKDYDKHLWDPFDKDRTILCEGHGRREILDEDGYPMGIPLPDYLTMKAGYLLASGNPKTWDYLLLERIRRDIREAEQ